MKPNRKHQFQMQIVENWANDTAVIVFVFEQRKKMSRGLERDRDKILI